MAHENAVLPMDPANPRHLYDLSKGLGESLCHVAVQGLIVTWNAAQRQLAIGVDGGTLGFLMVSGLLTVIGWAMREAARVKAENEGFV